MPPQSSRPKAGSVFLLALDGAEILYLPGTHEIVSRLQPAAPKAAAPVDPAPQKKKESKRSTG